SDRARLGARARRLRRRRAARRLERGVARAPGPPGARRPRSALVLVVAAPPDPGLVAPPGCAVEPLVHAPAAVEAARVGGVGVVDDAVLLREGAQAGPLAREGRPVRADAGGNLADRPRRPLRRPEVVLDHSRLQVLLRVRHAEVEVELAP